MFVEASAIGMLIVKMITNSTGTLNQCHRCPAWLPTSKPEDSTIQQLNKSFTAVL